MQSFVSQRCGPALRAAAIAVVAGACATAASHAASRTCQGALDDPSNAALRGSDLGAAQFGSDGDIANDLAVYTFVLSATEQVDFDNPGQLGNTHDEFSVTTPVPEPAGAWLASLGLAALLATSRTSRRRPGR